MLDLFPHIEPYEFGFLDVDNVHKIYWEKLGNKKGIPVIDRDEILEYRRHFDVLLEEGIAVGGGSYSILSAHLK